MFYLTKLIRLDVKRCSIKSKRRRIAQYQILTQRLTILENMAHCHYFILDTNYEMLINQTYKRLKQNIRYDIICRIN